MPTKVFGLPALEVEQPDGETVAYLIRVVPAPAGCWRSWQLVKPDGTSHTVSQTPAGQWRCSCKDFLYRRRFDVKRPHCKHIVAVMDSERERADASAEPPADDRGAGERLPRPRRGGEVPGHEGQDVATAG